VGHLGISQAHIEYIGQVLDAEVVALLQVEPTGQLQDLIRLLWLVGGHVRVVQQSSEQVQGEAADHRVRRADEQFLLQEQLQQAVSPQLQDINILAAGKVRDVAKDGQQDALLLGAQQEEGRVQLLDRHIYLREGLLLGLGAIRISGLRLVDALGNARHVRGPVRIRFY